MAGYLQWDTRWFKEIMFLDGKLWTTSERFWRLAADPRGAPHMIINNSMAGTDTLQKPFYGANRTDMQVPLIFQLGLKADIESEFYNLTAAEQSAESVDFIPFMYVTERIREAVEDEEYRLWRPMAYETSGSGATDVQPPGGNGPLVFKDGVLDMDAVVFSGTGDQAVTIAEAGDIVIHYCPTFKVSVQGMGISVSDPNDMEISKFQLTEVIAP